METIMTGVFLASHIGKEFLLKGQNLLRIRVRILDARARFGAIDYKVEPVTGEGWSWVSGAGVKLIDTTEGGTK